MTAVSVPQTDGDITLTLPGEPGKVYPVSKGKVDVPDEELPDFLASVSGAQVVGVKPAAASGVAGAVDSQ